MIMIVDLKSELILQFIAFLGVGLWILLFVYISVLRPSGIQDHDCE